MGFRDWRSYGIRFYPRGSTHVMLYHHVSGNGSQSIRSLGTIMPILHVLISYGLINGRQGSKLTLMNSRENPSPLITAVEAQTLNETEGRPHYIIMDTNKKLWEATHVKVKIITTSIAPPRKPASALRARTHSHYTDHTTNFVLIKSGTTR